MIFIRQSVSFPDSELHALVSSFAMSEKAF